MNSNDSLLNDRYIRIVLGIGALALVGALLTAIFAIFNGVIAIDNTVARTSSQYNLAKAEADVAQAQTAQTIGDLALEQTDMGRYDDAAATIATGRSLTLEDEQRNRALDYAEAYLFQARGDSEAAITGYENTRKMLQEEYERVLNSNASPNWAALSGLPNNYFASTYALAQLYMAQGDNTKALEMYDEYLAERGTAADVLVERGDLKLAMGDNAGAKADYEKALTYIPDDALALEGLQKVGGN
jgi:tetratricopeptide (TPR) repeat protein